MRESLLRYGQLRPVVCAEFNGKLYVVDGQHMLKALEFENMPVYYVVSEVKNKREAVMLMVKLNSSATPWKLYDYCHAFSKLGSLDYSLLLYFYNKYDYGITEIAGIVSSGTDFKGVTRKVKSGSFKVERSTEEAETLMSYIEDVLKTLPNIDRFRRAAIIRAFMKYYIFMGGSYSHTFVMKKVKEHHDTLLVLVEEKSFYQLFTS